MINDLEILHIYVHADLYKCIVILMGGFHQLHVKQRLIYERFNCTGIKD